MSCELCKQSYLDSYNVAVDTLTRENPAFSPHEIRARAAIQFRPIFHAMEVGSAIENIGEQEYENGGFALTREGEMYFLNTGQKADQLHTNQRRSSELTKDPAKYSVTDHQTTRLIQYAIAHGATVVRTSFAREGQNNRDILEYQYDRATNKGKIKVINTQTNGVQHDFHSIKEIARQRSQHLIEVAPLENVFIFTDAQLRQDRARAVVLTSREAQPPTVQSIQPEGQKQSFPTHEAFIREEVRVIDGVRGNMFTDTSRTVFRDTGEAISKMVTLLRDKEKRKEAVQRIRRIFRRENRTIDKNNAVAFQLSMKQESGRLTIEKIREKPVRVAKEIEKRHREMRQNVAVLVVVAETKVALGAAPVLLAMLAKEQPKSIRVEKSIKRHSKKELRIKNKELKKKVKRERKNLQKVQPLKTERIEPLRAAKERKVSVEKLTPIGMEKRRLKRHKKTELKRETKKDSVKVQPLIEKKRSIQRKEREAVREMVFGWMVWMMFVRKETETPKRSFIRSDLADLQGPTLQSKEDVPWVLLSIIYYLTAIREQGMQSNPTNPTNTPIRPIKNARVIPQHAVIFAYNS